MESIISILLEKEKKRNRKDEWEESKEEKCSRYIGKESILVFYYSVQVFTMSPILEYGEYPSLIQQLRRWSKEQPKKVRQVDDTR